MIIRNIYLLIKAGTARVPLRAGWERMLCEGEGPNSVKVPSLMLQVFCGTPPKLYDFQ